MLYRKLSKIKEALESIVTNEQLLESVFLEIPDLQEFAYSFTQEYDDNNYSNSVRVHSVNGRSVDWDGDYDDPQDEDEEENKLPMIEPSDVSKIIDLMQSIGSYWGYQEDFKFTREKVLENIALREKAQTSENLFISYAKAYVSGRTLPDKFFRRRKKDEVALIPEIAIFYGMDHGRLSLETEIKIFAKNGLMEEAWQYALYVIKGPLPTEIENFFVLNDQQDNPDHYFLKKYLEFVKEKKGVA